MKRTILAVVTITLLYAWFVNSHKDIQPNVTQEAEEQTPVTSQEDWDRMTEPHFTPVNPNEEVTPCTFNSGPRGEVSCK